MAIDKSFTILIPTFNRPNHLKRILNYYSKQNMPLGTKFIVADSSSDINKELNSKIVNNIKNLDLVYLNNFNSKIHPNHKISYAIEKVKTKYSIFCADDDFITISGISKAIDFLSKNSEFTCAHGSYTEFYLKGSSFFWKHIYPCKQIDFETPLERVTNHLKDYWPTFYAVHRTEFTKKIFQETRKFTSESFFGELLPTILTLIYGKMGYINIFYAARDGGSVPKTTDPKYFYNIYDFYRKGTFNDKYIPFLSCISKHLANTTELEIEMAESQMRKIINSFLNTNYNTTFQRFESLFHKIRLNMEKIGLPLMVDKSIRKIYQILFRTETYALKDIPISSFYDQFRIIKSHVTK